ncbi:MAG: hypothetical protein M3Z25_12515 [Actinomycetota bacterium]|nr:hypothetical protein [Actinomycetota bacterium]
MPRRLLLVLAVFAVALAPALHPAGQPSTVGSGPALGTTGRPAYPDSLFAPLDRPGPVFSVPAPALAAA